MLWLSNPRRNFFSPFQPLSPDIPRKARRTLGCGRSVSPCASGCHAALGRILAVFAAGAIQCAWANIAGETTASIHDSRQAKNAAVNSLVSTERLGQSSRATSLVISEMMYHPTNSELEFVELFNTRDEPEDLSGYQLGGSIAYTFPEGTIIPGGGFVVVAKAHATLQTAHGIGGVLGPFTNNLPNSGGTVILVNRSGAVFLPVDYSDRAPWPVAADAVNGPLDAANCNPLMDTKYQSLADNGIVWWDGKALTTPSAIKTWFSQRRAFLVSQLASVTPAFSVNPTITLSNGVGVVSGTAPVNSKTISIDGRAWSVDWVNVTNWTATVPLQSGTNRFSVAGLDSNGQPIAGASNQVSVVYGGAVLSPVGSVVINEIMFNPSTARAEYVELFNTATNYSFDLSGWNFNGLSYDFPGGTFLAPQSFLLLARDRVASGTAHGTGLPVFDVFPGNLQSDGETLSLIKPGATPALDLVVDRVRYETNAPWPHHCPALRCNSRTRHGTTAASAIGKPARIPPRQIGFIFPRTDPRQVRVFTFISRAPGKSVWTTSRSSLAAFPTPG